MHRIITQPATMVVEAKANTNKAGKLTNGWDLTGKLTGEVLSVGNATLAETSCPAGSFPWMPVSTTQYVKGITGDLKVNGIPLPNTPGCAGLGTRRRPNPHDSSASRASAAGGR